VAALQDKVIIITGAAGAIGGAVAAAVIAQGGTVVASDLKAGGGKLDPLAVTKKLASHRQNPRLGETEEGG
jgi:NAD(P)-dependent dehydrogenase (short-subunit alcohol dehydrogenase family)